MKAVHIIFGLALVVLGVYMEVQFSEIKPAVVSGIGFILTGLFAFSHIKKA